MIFALGFTTGVLVGLVVPALWLAHAIRGANEGLLALADAYDRNSTAVRMHLHRAQLSRLRRR